MIDQQRQEQSLVVVVVRVQYPHSFAVYHSTVYEEQIGHRTTAFKVILSERFACIKHVTALNLVEYCSFAVLFLTSRF